MSKFKIGDKVKEKSTGDIGVISHRPVWADPDDVTTGSTSGCTRYIEEDALEIVSDINLKAMLTNGRRVKLRNGKMYTVVDNALMFLDDSRTCGMGWASGSVTDSYNNDLHNKHSKNYDVVGVYEKPEFVLNYFNYQSPTKILWQREEKTAKQLQLEALQKQAQDVADAIKKLRDEE